MHRKIRAVVRADSLDEAVANAVDGLETAMDEDVLATGTVQTVVGDYEANEPFGPSTYFADDREQAGYRVESSAGRADLNAAMENMEVHGSTFIYTIDERDGNRTATPIPTEDAYDQLVTALQTKSDDHWVIAFDLRYEFNATPHKPNEMLKRDGTCGHDERDQSRMATPEGEVIDVCQDCRYQREWDNRADEDVVDEMSEE